MSIKLKKYTILESMITSYNVSKSKHDDYDYACITIVVVGGKEHVEEIYYNIKPTVMIHNRPAQEWARYYHTVLTEKEVNKFINKLENLK